MKASQIYKRARYNSCKFETLEDGTVIISMYNAKAKGKKHLSFKVKDLNKRGEQIIEDEKE